MASWGHKAVHEDTKLLVERRENGAGTQQFCCRGEQSPSRESPWAQEGAQRGAGRVGKVRESCQAGSSEPDPWEGLKGE